MNVFMSSINRRFILVLFACLFSFSCANVSTIRPSSLTNNLSNYKRAYIEPQRHDQFQLNQALLYELTDMGIEVVSTPFIEATESDLLVMYSFDTGWDFTDYLKAFQFQFVNAVSGSVVTAVSYHSTGIWLGRRDRRLEEAFNNLRKKNGFPATKQFD